MRPHGKPTAIRAATSRSRSAQFRIAAIVVVGLLLMLLQLRWLPQVRLPHHSDFLAANDETKPQSAHGHSPVRRRPVRPPDTSASAITSDPPAVARAAVEVELDADVSKGRCWTMHQDPHHVLAGVAAGDAGVGDCLPPFAIRVSRPLGEGRFLLIGELSYGVDVRLSAAKRRAEWWPPPHAVAASHWCLALCLSERTCDAFTSDGASTCRLWALITDNATSSSDNRETKLHFHPGHWSTVTPDGAVAGLPLLPGLFVDEDFIVALRDALTLRVASRDATPRTAPRGGRCWPLIGEAHNAAKVSQMASLAMSAMEGSTSNRVGVAVTCLSDASIEKLMSVRTGPRDSGVRSSEWIADPTVVAAVVVDMPRGFAARLCLSLYPTCATVLCQTRAAAQAHDVVGNRSTTCWLVSQYIDAAMTVIEGARDDKPPEPRDEQQEWVMTSLLPGLFSQPAATVRSNGSATLPPAALVAGYFQPRMWPCESIPPDFFPLPSGPPGRVCSMSAKSTKPHEEVPAPRELGPEISWSRGMTSGDCAIWCLVLGWCQRSYFTRHNAICKLFAENAAAGITAANEPAACFPMIHDPGHVSSGAIHGRTGGPPGTGGVVTVPQACALPRDLERVFVRHANTEHWLSRARVEAHVSHAGACLSLCASFTWCLSVRWSRPLCGLFAAPFLAKPMWSANNKPLPLLPLQGAPSEGLDDQWASPRLPPTAPLVDHNEAFLRDEMKTDPKAFSRHVDASTYETGSGGAKPTLSVALLPSAASSASVAASDAFTLATLSTWAKSHTMQSAIVQWGEDPSHSVHQAALPPREQSSPFRLVFMIRRMMNRTHPTAAANWLLVSRNDVFIFKRNLAATLKAMSARSFGIGAVVFAGSVKDVKMRRPGTPAFERMLRVVTGGGAVILNGEAAGRLAMAADLCHELVTFPFEGNFGDGEAGLAFDRLGSESSFAALSYCAQVVGITATHLDVCRVAATDARHLSQGNDPDLVIPLGVSKLRSVEDFHDAQVREATAVLHTRPKDCCFVSSQLTV